MTVPVVFESLPMFCPLGADADIRTLQNIADGLDVERRGAHGDIDFGDAGGGVFKTLRQSFRGVQFQIHFPVAGNQKTSHFYPRVVKLLLSNQSRARDRAENFG